MAYAAHIREDGTEQTIEAHVTGVAHMAADFAAAFGAEGYAAFCGMLHDIGKYALPFQRRIHGEPIATDHSTAGAIEARRLLEPTGYQLAYLLAGHHAGLPDGGSEADVEGLPTLRSRLQKRPADYEAYRGDIDPAAWLPKAPPPLRFTRQEAGYSLAFFLRMLFSCLVDADFLDTEAFMQGARAPVEGDIAALADKVAAYVRRFENPATEIHRLRTEILHRCMDKAAWERGLYTLTVPTGGGKTISSLAFALLHARAQGLRRVIYVIPYQSIIDQNAAEFRKILGAEAVLEHHANVAFDERDELDARKKLAAENWDMPVVVTTAVQFFESFYANRPSHCRKLHNVADSVIVFDEAQMFPLPYLRPCLRVIEELVRNYRCTAVLCTATQPALGAGELALPADLPVRELCGDTARYYAAFRRTRIVSIGPVTKEELAARLNDQPQALCIVRTRQQAQSLFAALEGEGVYHLSTWMYPRHRQAVLQGIRERLNPDHPQPCRVVSTSLIEAGVDVDFPVVYRAAAGLDSILQAAGRCNREGRREESPVYVFEWADPDAPAMPARMARPLEVAKAVMAAYDDVGDPAAVERYFEELYRRENLDAHGIVPAFNGADFRKGEPSYPFAQVAREFHLIDDDGGVLFIPNGEEAAALAARLRAGERSRGLLREAQQYSVGVYRRMYDSLYGAGCLEPLEEGFAILTDRERYDKRIGLVAGPESGQGIFA